MSASLSKITEKKFLVLWSCLYGLKDVLQNLFQYIGPLVLVKMVPWFQQVLTIKAIDPGLLFLLQICTGFQNYQIPEAKNFQVVIHSGRLSPSTCPDLWHFSEVDIINIFNNSDILSQFEMSFDIELMVTQPDCNTLIQIEQVLQTRGCHWTQT